MSTEESRYLSKRLSKLELEVRKLTSQDRTTLVSQIAGMMVAAHGEAPWAIGKDYHDGCIRAAMAIVKAAEEMAK